LEVDGVGSGGIGEMLGGDLELRRQRRERAVDEAGHVQHDAAVHEQPGWKVGNVELGADTAAADAACIRGRGGGVDAAEQLAVAADVANGVDARRTVLAAGLLDLRAEREL